jgi:hypothetical protein
MSSNVIDIRLKTAATGSARRRSSARTPGGALIYAVACAVALLLAVDVRLIRYVHSTSNQELVMFADLIYVAGIVLLAALVATLAIGCAQLGERK